MLYASGLTFGLLFATVALAGPPELPVAANIPVVPDKPTSVKIGFPEALFKDVPDVLIQAAAKPFQKIIQKDTGLSATLEVVPDYKTLAHKLAIGKVDIAVFHGFEYAWIQDTPNLIPMVVTMPSCGKVQACLVVSADSKAKSAKDLKGACVAVPKGSKAHCQMFLKHLYQVDKVPAECCCPNKVKNLTPEEALDEVVRGNSAAALVDVSALMNYEANKPGVFAQLKVLRESQPLPSAIVVYRKGSLTPDEAANMRTGLLNCNKTASGRAFTMFWNLDGFREVSPAYNAAVALSLKHYPAPTETDAKPVVKNASGVQVEDQ